MTIYKLKKPKAGPKEGDKKHEGNYDYVFINGTWRETHYKDPDGYEAWWGRDTEGNCIHFKCSDGEEIWRDENDKIITEEEFNKIWEKVE